MITATEKRITDTENVGELKSLANDLHRCLMWDDIQLALIPLYRRGTLDVCEKNKKALHKLASLGYVQQQATGPDTYTYRITNKGRAMRCHLRLNASAAPEYHVGDHVTLCPTEFDGCEWDVLYRLQYVNRGINLFLVTTPKEYKPEGSEGPHMFIRENIEYDEVRHATYEEYMGGVRDHG